MIDVIDWLNLTISNQGIKQCLPNKWIQTIENLLGNVYVSKNKKKYKIVSKQDVFNIPNMLKQEFSIDDKEKEKMIMMKLLCNAINKLQSHEHNNTYV